MRTAALASSSTGRTGAGGAVGDEGIVCGGGALTTYELGPVPKRTTPGAALVRRLVAAQFPHWAALPIEPVAHGGWDNATFHLGDEMLVRMPSAAEYALAVDKEHRWLPALAPQLPRPVPTPLARGEASAEYPFPWSVYAWLEGEPARVDRISAPDLFGEHLAEFVAALRSIDTTGGPRPGTHNWFRGGSLRTFEPLLEQALETLGDHVDADLAREIWSAARGAPWDGVTCGSTATSPRATCSWSAGTCRR